MNGQVQISKIKSAIVFQKKGNEIIARLNIPWEGKLPADNFGILKVQYSEQKIIIDASGLNVIQFVVCDLDGNQKIANVLGFLSDA